MSALQTTGRRFERLLYFGILVIAATVMDSWVATGAAQLISNKRADYFNTVARFISLASYHLDDQYEYLVATPNKKKELMTQRQWLRDVYAVDYLTALKDELASIERFNEPPSPKEKQRVLEIFDKRLPPKDVVEELKRAPAARPESLTVSGIDAPSSVKLEFYGNTLLVPMETVSAALHIILLPVIFIWGGSVVITRFKELAYIRRARSAENVFPHLLNIALVHLPDQSVKRGRDLARAYKTLLRVTRALRLPDSSALPDPADLDPASFARVVLLLLIVWPAPLIHINTTMSSLATSGELAPISVIGYWFAAYIVLLTPFVYALIVESNRHLRLPRWFIE